MSLTCPILHRFFKYLCLVFGHSQVGDINIMDDNFFYQSVAGKCICEKGNMAKHIPISLKLLKIMMSLVAHGM